MKIILFTVMMICYYVFNKRGYLVDNIAVKKPSAELWHWIPSCVITLGMWRCPSKVCTLGFMFMLLV